MKRKALTLVELLAVIAIIITTLALAVPALRPLFSGRKQRETSRLVQAFIKGAQARAAELGRPVGVWIERFDGTIEREAMYATQLFYAEIPPVYKGDVADSRAWFFEIDSTNNSFNWVPPSRPTFNTFQIKFTFSPMLDQLVGVGEVFYGNFGNDYLYRIRKVGVDANNEGIFILADTRYPPIEGIMHPPPNQQGPVVLPTFQNPNQFFGNIVPGMSAYGVPYKLYLPPRKVTERPVQLPQGACIDLSVSGIGGFGVEFNPSRPSILNQNRPIERGLPVVIAFHPEGHVDRVWGPFQFNPRPSQFQLVPDVNDLDSWVTGFRPNGSVHLLVGTIEQVWPGQSGNAWQLQDMFFESETLNGNLNDSNNSWVSISHRTGIVTVNEIGLDDPTIGTSQQNLQERLYKTREFARTGLGIGGQ